MTQSDVYSIKEVVNELRSEVKEATANQVMILERIEHIAEKQLEIAEANRIRNGRIEKVEAANHKLQNRMSQLWGGISLLGALGVAQQVIWAAI